MKKLLVASILFLSLSSFSAFGQVYERVYELSGAEVQQKMNQNKMQGVAILSGIQADHVIGISGLNSTQKTQLEELFSGDSRIKSAVIDGSLSSVALNTDAGFLKDDFVNLVAPLSLVVTGYTVTYSIIE